jgi:hypothetical protein
MWALDKRLAHSYERIQENQMALVRKGGPSPKVKVVLAHPGACVIFLK